MDELPRNVWAMCLLCFVRFTTSQQAVDNCQATCPSCSSNAVTVPEEAS